MAKMFKKFGFFLLVLLIAGLGSCKELFDDIKEAKVDFVTEFGLHLADVSLYIDKTLTIDVDTIIEGMPQPVIELSPGEDGILKMHMTQKYNHVKLDTMLNLKDSVYVDSTGFPALSGFFVEGLIDFGFQLKTFDNETLNGKKIDSLKLDSGTLTLEFNTYDQFYSEFTITFPGIFNEENEVLKIEDFIPTVQKNTIDIDLTNHKIQVLRKREKEYFLIKLNFYIESLDDDTRIDPKIRFRMANLDLDYVYGAFGYDIIPGFDEQEIEMPGKLFDNQDVTLDFKRPEIKLHVLNSFELPFRYDIKRAVMHYEGGHTENITGIPANIFVDAPTSENPTEYVSSVIELDPSTNIDILLGKGPELLTIDGDLWTNPDNPFQRNYLRDEDSLAATLDIDLPFEMLVSEIVIRDTTYSEIFEPLQNSNFDAVQVKVKTDVSNSFPFDLNLQTYFYDGYGSLIDSLFDDPVVVRGAGEGDRTIEATYYSDKSKSEIEHLYDTQKAIVVAWFKTAGAQEEKIVSFRNEHKLDVKLTLFTRINVQTGKNN